MQTLSFTKQPNSDGIYFVHDKLSTLVTIGRVGRTPIGWVATPGREPFEGTIRYAFNTRREAAYALARYTDTGDSNWISPTR